MRKKRKEKKWNDTKNRIQVNHQERNVLCLWAPRRHEDFRFCWKSGLPKDNICRNTHTHKSQTSSNGRKANVLEHTTITSQVVQHLNRNYFNNFSYRTRACIVRAGSNKRHRTLFTFTQSAVRSEWIGGAFSMGFHSESSDGSSVQMCSCVCVCAMYILPEFSHKTARPSGLKPFAILF